MSINFCGINKILKKIFWPQDFLVVRSITKLVESQYSINIDKDRLSV